MNALDRIEFDSLFAALCHQEIPPAYIHLLSCLYRSQNGHLKDGPRFAIQRGVKQGDVLSPTLINAGLEHAFRSWKAKLSTQGLHVGVPQRLTNVRYADDIVVYAKTADELHFFMMNALVEELNKIGLHLSPLKTKILTTVDVGAPLYLDSKCLSNGLFDVFASDACCATVPATRDMMPGGVKHILGFDVVGLRRPGMPN